MNTEEAVKAVEGSETIKEIVSRIDIYAEKLGVLAVDIFEIIVRQQYVEAILSIISFVGLFLITFFLFRFCVKAWVAGWENKDYDKNEAYIVSSLFSTGASVFAGVATIGYFFAEVIPSIGKLINPAYYAILEIRALF